MDTNHPESLLAAAERVLAVLREFQTDALVIGAVVPGLSAILDEMEL